MWVNGKKATKSQKNKSKTINTREKNLTSLVRNGNYNERLFFFFAFQNDILKDTTQHQQGRDKGISWCSFSGKQVRKKPPRDFPGSPVVKNLPAKQGTWVRSLVWEDPTCRGAAMPVHHNYWAWALEPGSCSSWAHSPRLLSGLALEPLLCNKRRYCNEKPSHHN